MRIVLVLSGHEALVAYRVVSHKCSSLHGSVDIVWRYDMHTTRAPHVGRRREAGGGRTSSFGSGWSDGVRSKAGQK